MYCSFLNLCDTIPIKTLFMSDMTVQVDGGEAVPAKAAAVPLLYSACHLYY